MVIYIARCRDMSEAKSMREKLMSTCPALVYSRVLRTMKDLDVYNSEMLRSGDEEFEPGHFTFDGTERANGLGRQRIGWSILALFCLLAAIVLGVQLFGARSASHLSVALLAALLVATIGVASFMAVRSSRGMSAEHRAYTQAAAWLKRGRPVVIVGSDEPLDDEDSPLGRRVSFFIKPVRKNLRHTA